MARAGVIITVYCLVGEHYQVLGQIRTRTILGRAEQMLDGLWLGSHDPKRLVFALKRKSWESWEAEKGREKSKEELFTPTEQDVQPIVTPFRKGREVREKPPEVRGGGVEAEGGAGGDSR